MNDKAAPAPSCAPAAIGSADSVMILSGLERINDPMLTYLVAMAIDRAADLVRNAERRQPPATAGSGEIICDEPHGISYSSRAAAGS